MKYKWLNRINTDKIIVFYNGWGMDENIINHLFTEDYNLLMFYDYNDLKTDFDYSELNSYKEKYLIAWSMGVMTATFLPKDISFTQKIAINGTLFPVDEKFGINPKIYDLTIKGFNPKSCEKFIQNMFSEPYNINIQRDFENQKRELIALKNYISNKDFKYDKVLISDSDKIIPTKNQCNFWNINPNFTSGHCPFLSFNTWSDLLCQIKLL